MAFASWKVVTPYLAFCPRCFELSVVDWESVSGFSLYDFSDMKN